MTREQKLNGWLYSALLFTTLLACASQLTLAIVLGFAMIGIVTTGDIFGYMEVTSASPILPDDHYRERSDLCTAAIES